MVYTYLEPVFKVLILILMKILQTKAIEESQRLVLIDTKRG